MSRRNWTEEETMMAFALYFILPTRAIDDTGEDVIRFANAIGRTPSAVAMKIWNIAAYDENRVSQGKVGLTRGSKLDQTIWAWYREKGDSFVSDAAELLAKKLSKKSGQKGPITYAAINLPEGSDRQALVSQRVNQQYFRNTLIANYQAKCCITGIDIESLLIASHIKPWAVSDPRTERLSPGNGLLLNALHDRAFDKGLITIDHELKIRVSSNVKKSAASFEWLQKFHGETIRVPKKFPPGIEFIEYHNDCVFLH